MRDRLRSIDTTAPDRRKSKSRAPAKRWGLTLAVLSLLVVHSLLVLDSAAQKSATADEHAHLPAGLAWVATDGAVRLNAEQPPLVKRLAGLTASTLEPNLPLDPPPSGRWMQWTFGMRVLYLQGNDYWRLLFRGRLPTLAFSWIGALAVFAWSRDRWGATAGLTSLSLWCFSPTILAHARLVTFDLPVAALWVTTLYIWWRQLRSGDRSRPWSPILSGVALGAALGTKYNAPLLIPAMALVEIALDGREVLDRSTWRERALRWSLALGSALVTVWMIFGFPLDPWFYIEEFGHIYEGFDEEPRFFLAGHTDTRFPHYFLATLGLKSSWIELVLLFAAMGATWRRARLASRRNEVVDPLPEGSARELADDLALWLPAALWVAALSVVAFNWGHRYMTAVYPLLFVLSGGVVAIVPRSWGRLAVGGAALVAGSCQASVALAHHPNYLPYFQPLAGGVECGPWWLHDSNVDWGQDVAAARPWLEEMGLREMGISTVRTGLHRQTAPRAFGIPSSPLELDDLRVSPPADGAYLISANILSLGLAEHAETGAPTDWLERYTPVGVLNGSLYLYVFPESAAAPSTLCPSRRTLPIGVAPSAP